MSIFDGNMPYTNLHELNTDWLVKTVKEVKDKEDSVDESVAQAKESEENAKASELNAKESEENAKISEVNSRGYYENITEYTELLNNRVTQNTNDIAVNSSRIDNLSQLSEGSTTGDAELQDIRVGVDGTVYPTAGDAVREQMENVDNKLNGVSSAFVGYTNVFNSNAVTENEKITGPGYTPGYFPTQTDSNWYTSDYIKVSENDVVRINKVRRCLGYTSNGEQFATIQLVWESTLSSGVFTVPSTINYIRFGALKTELDGTMVTINSEMPSAFIPYNAFTPEYLKENLLPPNAVYGYNNIGMVNNYIYDKSSLSVFGQATFTNNVVTVNGANGGVQTPKFNVNEKIDVYIKTTSNLSLSSLRIQLGYERNGSTYYNVIDRLLNGETEKHVVIDLPYYSVYESASNFSIVLNTGDSSGSFGIDTFYIRTYSEIEQVSFYSDTFPTMMSNLDDKLKNYSDTKDNILFLSNSNGVKYKLAVNSDTLQLIPTIPNKTLFTGNSLLRGFHDLTNDTYFGMCATDKNHDYYHYVTSAITNKNANAIFSKSSSVGLEQAESTSDQINWLNGQINAGYINSDLDLIILQLGDNVNTNSRLSTFTTGFGSIISQIRNLCTKARIIIVGSWFVSFNEVLTTLKNTADTYGCEFIDISALNTTENQATSGQTVTWSDGTSEVVSDSFITHPGNTGFIKIANKIIEKLNM